MSAHSSTFPHPILEQVVLQPAFEDAILYYYQPMLAANRAHVVMLARCGIITPQNAQALLAALALIQSDGAAALTYESGIEDLFFAMERRLIQLVGAEYGGNLQLARSRNDLGYALTRLALRPYMLQTMRLLLGLRALLLDFARSHLHTLMPGYTHTQPAQPTTMAHYIGGVLGFLERDTERLRFAWHTNNRSPLGAAALTGTGFPIDRDLSASLLGFDGVIASTYDCIGASDNLTDVAAALTSIGINLSRFTKDLLFWATQESGAIHVDSSFIQISSIMPQKRNPLVLEHLRARISRMIGYAQAVVMQCHNTPFGDTQDVEGEILPLIFGGLQASSEILQLYGAVIETLQVNVEHLRARALDGFMTVTELADVLVREAHLPFRQAHSIVSGMVTRALQQGLHPSQLSADLLAQVSEAVTGTALHLSDDLIQQALDPQTFVERRSLSGGAAPAATAAVLVAAAERLQHDRNWLAQCETRLMEASDLLEREAQVLLTEREE
jgi:argininosuccinate lyase